MDDFGRQFEEEWEKYQKENKIFPNIMILGRTGVGKSSLINMIFGQERAKTSSVKPETQEFKVYYGRENNININLIDSKGYEINDYANTSEESMREYINEIKRNIEDYENDGLKVHIIWYCISVSESRIEPLDKELIKELSRFDKTRGRMSVVFTKCDQDDEEGSTAMAFREIIDGLGIRNLQSFEVSTDPGLPLELDKLNEWSMSLLDDDDLRANYVASQMLNLNLKRKEAVKIIHIAATAAAAIGATPIPFSDSALLVPTQIGMVVKITSIYGIYGLAHISKEALSSLIISNIGKSLAGGLLKLIPGVGTVIGGAINAGVAAAITEALGFAVSEICYHACKDIMNGKSINWDNLLVLDSIKPLFDNNFKKLDGKK